MLCLLCLVHMLFNQSINQFHLPALGLGVLQEILWHHASPADFVPAYTIYCCYMTQRADYDPIAYQ